jgi:hypothetical protein
MDHHLPEMIECIGFYAHHAAAAGPLLEDPALGGIADDLTEVPIMPCIFLTTVLDYFQSPNVAIF